MSQALRPGRPALRSGASRSFGWRSIALALAAVAMLAGAFVIAPVRVVAADPNPNLRVEPPSLSVDGGQTFTVTVVQFAGVATTGAQTTFGFNPALVQVLRVEPGPGYASALFLFGAADDGTSASLDLTIAKANQTGQLKNLATLLLPGSGSVPPGDALFLTITLQARPGPGGAVPLLLAGDSILDENGATLPIASTGHASSLTIRPSAGASGGTETVAPSGTPGPSVVGGSPVPGTSSGPATVQAVPNSIQVKAGDTATTDLTIEMSGPASSVVVDLAFDKAVLEITDVKVGPDWKGAALIAGGTGGSLAEALAAANANGVMSQVGAYLVPGLASPPTGKTVFLTVTFKALKHGTSSLAVIAADVLGPDGAALPVTLPDGRAVVAPSAGIDGFLIALAILVVVIVGLIVIVRIRGRGRPRRSYLYPSMLVLALIPVVMFGGLVVMLVVNSLTALTAPGLAAIFSDRFSSAFSLTGNKHEYGLLPAVWGTVEITFIAIAFALPVALAMAIIATEYPTGPLGRILRPLLGILSGVPPIVYAVAGVVFVTLFIAPKFAGSADFSAFDPARLGADPASWPPADVPWNPTSFPWPPNSGGIPSSTLLGGFLIGLLVIPFMTPLIFDAMRNIPTAAKEASFALGANRGYTLRRVVLPLALPGVVAAVALATLKAMGDVLIVALVVGWQAETFPNPIVDVFERTSTLAVEGANLLGNLEQAGAGRACSTATASCSVGYFSALILLLVAAGVVVAATVLEGRLRRRVRA